MFALDNQAFKEPNSKSISLETHVVNQTVRNIDLRSYSILKPLEENTLLHVTEVPYREDQELFEVSIKSACIYCVPYNFFLIWQKTYINGVQVVKSDACLAENGIVHIVKSTIPHYNYNLAYVLRHDTKNFSNFLSLMNASDVRLRSNASYTVFLPTNDAFEKLGEGVVDCLLRPKNRKYARKLLLNHITDTVEYTSSLSQRRRIETYNNIYLRVRVIDGTVHLTWKEIPLFKEDEVMHNGVFHVIKTVILDMDTDAHIKEFCTSESTPSPIPSIEPVLP